jgi:hypothetical protein
MDENPQQRRIFVIHIALIVGIITLMVIVAVSRWGFFTP